MSNNDEHEQHSFEPSFQQLATKSPGHEVEQLKQQKALQKTTMFSTIGHNEP
jgi:hypothetical protein